MRKKEQVQKEKLPKGRKNCKKRSKITLSCLKKLDISPQIKQVKSLRFRHPTIDQNLISPEEEPSIF